MSVSRYEYEAPMKCSVTKICLRCRGLTVPPSVAMKLNSIERERKNKSVYPPPLIPSTHYQTVTWSMKLHFLL